MASPDAAVLSAIRAERWADAVAYAQPAIASAAAGSASLGTLHLYAGIACSKLGDNAGAEGHFVAAADIPDCTAKAHKALLDLYAATGK